MPGLIAASVCNMRLRGIVRSVRFFALMIPALTVASSLNGLPIASTHSPISSDTESPNSATGIGRSGSTRTTATSLSGSPWTAVATISVSSASCTTTRRAFFTT